MAEHILFLTGKLAEFSLQKVLRDMRPTEFTYHVHQLGLSAAALMTTDLIACRLKDTQGADPIVVPGHCRGDIEALSRQLGVKVERGPKELKELPQYFGYLPGLADISNYDVQIFAEIVEAPELSVADIVRRAERYRQGGADQIRTITSKTPLLTLRVVRLSAQMRTPQRDSWPRARNLV